SQIAELEGLLATAILEFERSYEEMRNASGLWRGRAGLGEALALPVVQRDLAPANGFLLYYVVGPEESFLWLIPPRGRQPEVLRLRVPPAIASALAIEPGALTASAVRHILAPAVGGGLLEQLSAPPGRSRGRAEAALHALFQALVPPPLWARVGKAAE